MRELSLFSGAGGGLLATRWLLGWRTVAYVERDAYCRSVLRARIKQRLLDDAPIFEDVRAFDGTAWAGNVDVITAGYPCQPFSVAGKRRGADDERHLWPEVARLVREVRPSLAFLENVPGHLRLGFDAVLADLAALGFDAEWTTLGADDVGAPHRRKRLWILAHAPDAGAGRGGELEGGGEGEGTLADADVGKQQHQRESTDREIDVGPQQGRPELRAGGRRQAVADAARNLRTGPALSGAERERAGSRGESPGVADTGRGVRAGARGPGDLGAAPADDAGEGLQRQRVRHAVGDGGQAVADADGRRLEGERLAERRGLQRAPGSEPDRRRARGRGQGPDVGDAAGARPPLGEDQRGDGHEEQPPAERAGGDWWAHDPAELADPEGLAVGTGLRSSGSGGVGWRRPGDGGGAPGEGQSESELGRVADGLAAGLDLARPHRAVHVPRVAAGIRGRVPRLRALGNGQVPLCAAQAFLILYRELMENP